jgi:hypothetical protein
MGQSEKAVAESGFSGLCRRIVELGAWARFWLCCDEGQALNFLFLAWSFAGR